MGIREAACGKWPLRDRVERGMFWGKKLDREITIGTDRWEGQKVNWGQSMEGFEWQFKKSDHFHSVFLRQRSEDNPKRGPHFWSWVPGLPQFPTLPSTLCSLECGPAERCITPFSGPSSPRGGRSRTGWSSSWYLLCRACSNTLCDTLRLCLTKAHVSKWGRVTWMGCRPIQGIDWTLSQETHQLPGTQSVITAVLAFREHARLSWLEEMVLPWAWQARENRQCHGATSSLVWFCPQLAKTREEYLLSASAHLSRVVLAVVKLHSSSQHFSIWTPIKNLLAYPGLAITGQ